MIFIESILFELFSNRRKISDLDVLCLSTSNPVYLVFNKDDFVPEFVIRLIDHDKMKDMYKTHQELYEYLDNMVSKPLGCHQVGSQHYLIEAGLKGTPWYQLANTLDSKSGWNKIKKQAATALNNFHCTINSSSNWHQQVEFGNELRRRYRECQNYNIEFPEGTEKIVLRYALLLDSFSVPSSFYQHGDFCLNNLLFDGDNTYIIDFEDFGMTSMPFHDEFTLALSFCTLEHSSQLVSFKVEFDLCLSQSIWKDILPSEIYPALFMHHLLLRIGVWGHMKERTEYCKWLMNVLNELLIDQKRLFE